MGAPQTDFVAKIHLSISLPYGHDYDAELLERQIRAADTEGPWVTQYPTGDSAPSIGSMSKIEMDELAYNDRRYRAVIQPTQSVGLHQVHAYNCYANQLAENLARIMKDKDEVWFVGVTLELESFQKSYAPSDY